MNKEIEKVELLTKIINVINERNLMGLYIDPYNIDNEIYFDPKYSDYRTFGLTMFYIDGTDIKCKVELYGEYGSYDDIYSLSDFYIYELEQILKLVSVDGEISDSYINEAWKYQKEHPEYWLNDE